MEAIITKTLPYGYNGRECFYILSFPKGGLMLVSAYDADTPVPGYGFNHRVPDSIINEAVEGWFDNYARQIDTAFMLNLHAVAPILKWADKMENRFVPAIGYNTGTLLTAVVKCLNLR